MEYTTIAHFLHHPCPLDSGGQYGRVLFLLRVDHDACYMDHHTKYDGRSTHLFCACEWTHIHVGTLTAFDRCGYVMAMEPLRTLGMHCHHVLISSYAACMDAADDWASISRRVTETPNTQSAHIESMSPCSRYHLQDECHNDRNCLSKLIDIGI